MTTHDRRDHDVPFVRWRQQGRLGLWRKLWRHLGVVLFNMIGTHIPSHLVRQTILRLWGAKIGRDSAILRGTTVLGIESLIIGDQSTIGFRCMLDARGGVKIGDNVVIASDVHFITAGHDIDSPDFAAWYAPVVVEDYVWIASRATVASATIGRGAVVAACAMVREDVPTLAVVGGVPAKQIGSRSADALRYSGRYRPPLF